LADYRNHYSGIEAAGATVAAVSVDPPAKSEHLRIRLSLPFPILCDTDRKVVKAWDVYDSREKGGIAKPAVFIVDSNCVVRYASVDTVAKRIPASEILRILDTPGEAPLRRRVHFPRLSNWLTAIRNHVRA